MLPFGAWVIVRMVAPGKKLSLTSAGSIVVDDTTYAKANDCKCCISLVTRISPGKYFSIEPGGAGKQNK